MNRLTFLFIVICGMTISCKKDKAPEPTPTPAATPITTIGASYAGGLVIYIDASQNHGLVAAPNDQITGIKWYDGPNNQIFTGTDWYENIGYGQSNSTFIVNHYGPGNYAAYLCDTLNLNGYNDWFLPSRNELNQIYQSLYTSSGMVGDYYWSSTEAGSGQAWAYNPITASMQTYNKSTLARVRAVRAF